jgi:uncharacterized protein YkuJ
MSSRSEMRRSWRFLCGFLAVVALSPLACNKTKQAPATTTASAVTTAKGQLVIEDNALGAWIAMNNTFAMPTLASRDPHKHYYWAGILLQIGDYPVLPGTQPPRFEFDQLYFSKEGKVVGTPLMKGSYTNKKFWVNVVAKRDTDYVAPLTDHDVAALYPGTNPAPLCADATASDSRCLRGNKIHGGMEPVTGIVTYWQGSNGFSLNAVQEAEDLGSKYTFGLLDDFAVDIYDLASTGAATLVKSYTYGEVDRITVAKRAFGPSDGDRLDPPWPGK